ncbi:hypothetical protein evm_008164 [Chilo suppressalis]|nr:hypothetical protein evm_008164 [Chilo suppressalis]
MGPRGGWQNVGSASPRLSCNYRANPSVSQPLVLGANQLLASTNYRPDRKTVILVHDLQSSAVGLSNAVLLPAFLAAGDVNVLLVDWSTGADSGTLLSTFFSALSGNHVARFLNWLSESSGADLADYHLVGVGLGAWNVGFIGRRLRSRVGYITALDPSKGPSVTSILPALNPTVALYTEVIHSTAGTTGYEPPIGDVDFYPNGGAAMPGCGNNSECSRNRAVYYFAESVHSGGFTGVECESHRDALSSSCNGEGRLKMGGLNAKTGSRGVYHLETNALPPFSRG